MKYYELKCTVYLKKDISFEKSFYLISKYISYAMCQDEELESLHKEYKKYTNYCYGGFHPREENKIYKQGNTYRFEIRSIDESFIDKLSYLLKQNTNNENLIIVQTEKRFIKQSFISELYTATPTIISTKKENKTIFWTIKEDGDILKLQNQLHENMLKKYKEFYNEELKSDVNFIQLIEIKNQKPQTIKLRNKEKKEYRLFGNKFRIIPNEDEVSQKLAFLALGVGLGEKSAFGGGFCVGKVMK